GEGGMGVLQGRPGKFGGVGRVFSFAGGVFRSPEGQQSESASGERREGSCVAPGESQRLNGWNHWSATAGQNRRLRSSHKSGSSTRPSREREGRSQRQTRR